MKKTAFLSFFGFLLSLAVTAGVQAAPPMVAVASSTRNALAPGDNVTLSVTATGGTGVVYQWTHNGQNIGGATGADLTITNATAHDAGYYVALVTDDTPVTQISAPFFVSVTPAVTQVRGWGDDTNGQTDVPGTLEGAVAIANCVSHSLALKSDGTVVAWGKNDVGQSTVPNGLTDVVAVAGADTFSLALKSDGTVIAWGQNQVAQLSPPGGLSGVVAIAASGLYSLALKSDGTVVGWGYNNAGQLSLPSAVTSAGSNVVAISAGGYHALALKSDGSVVAWGDDSSNQTNVPALSTATAIAAASSTSYALKSDGTIAAWGDNFFGEISGDPGTPGVVAIASGSAHVLALYGDGTVQAWGNNDAQQTTVPADLLDLTTAKVLAVSANGDFSLALRDGTGGSNPAITTPPAGQTVNEAGTATFSVVATGVDPWGYQWRKGGVAIAGATASTFQIVGVSPADAGDYDVVVSNYAGSVTSAVATLAVNAGPTIGAQSSVQQLLNVGQSLDLSVTASGTGTVTYQWFHNGLPISGATGSALSIPVAAFGDSGYYLVLATDTGTSGQRRSAPIFVTVKPAATLVRAWGADPDGETDIPGGLTNIVALAAGGEHVLALSSDGTVGAWGADDSHQTEVPGGLSGVVAIAAGSEHSVALRSDGTVIAWGRNSEGQATVPAGLANVVAISAGAFHTLALKSDGTVVAWGKNDQGQISVPTDLAGVVAVAAGSYHNLALISDGSVVAWGANTDGQSNVPSGLTGVVAIAANGHSLAVKSDGTVVAWGPDDSLQTNVPGNLTPASAVAAGGGHSLALQRDGTVAGWGANDHGQTAIPADLTDVIAVSANSSFSLALRDSSADPLAITSDPLTQEVVAFQHVILSVSVTGYFPTYQWRYNNAPISGQTAATLDLGNVPVSAAGSYDVVVTNYLGHVTSAGAVLTVDKADPVITWATPGAITYGTALDGTQLDATANIPGTFVYSPASGAVVAAGAQMLGVTFTPTDSANYNNAPGSTTLTVNAAPTTFALSSTTFTYTGSAQGPTIDPTPSSATFTSGGTLSTTAAGSYTATATATGDYIGTNNTLNWSIAKAAQTISFTGPGNQAFSTTPIPLSATASSGLSVSFSVVSGPATVSGANLTLTGTGTVVVRAAQAGDSNYTAAANVDQSLTVSQATAIVTLGSLSATYDGTAKAATATTSPAGLTVTFTYNGSPTAPSAAGSYAVVGTINDPNYTGTGSGTLVIAKASLTVTADARTRLYGAANPTFTATVSGFANGETSTVVTGTAALSTPATVASPVAAYVITPTVGSLSAANYNFGSFVAGTLTVTPAPLTVTADSKQRALGAANPALTVSYAGFVNSEDASALTTAPTATTTATTSSVVGVYPITASGGVSSNYTFSYVDGTLTIVKYTLSDYNGDGQTDLLWENTAGVDRAVWYLNGTGIGGFDYLAGVANEWHIVGEADFNGDGQTDILWENTLTGDRSVWLMNGTAILDFPYLAYVDPSWHIAAVGDFNGDGQTDILWENAESGGVDRAIWYLNGTTIQSFGYLAGIPSEWHIVGTGDFNGDGQTDIVWEDTVTGDRSIWLMDGTNILDFFDLGNVAPAWHIAMVADFNGDGKVDLLWENRTTGDRVFWLMDGTTHTSSVYLAYVDPAWHIAP